MNNRYQFQSNLDIKKKYDVDKSIHGSKLRKRNEIDKQGISIDYRATKTA